MINKILAKQKLSPSVYCLKVKNPFIAKKAKAGQFVILRIDEEGENSSYYLCS
jgi:ferredoxin--NADP+ reductase